MARLFAPLSSSFLGFDSLFSELERMLDIASNTSPQGGYPPMNLYREDSGDYTIEVAVAGFKKEHITIEHNEQTGILSIFGDSTYAAAPPQEDKKLIKSDRAKSDSTALATTQPTSVATFDNRKVLKQGIASRQFVRHFTLADGMKVRSAKLEDGLLHISIGMDKPEVPEYLPLRIKVD